MFAFGSLRELPLDLRRIAVGTGLAEARDVLRVVRSLDWIDDGSIHLVVTSPSEPPAPILHDNRPQSSIISTRLGSLAPFHIP